MLDFHVNILGESIRIRKVGDSNRVVVFLHGSSLSLEMWDQQISHPSFSEFSLVAVDFPGHGQSDKSQNAQVRYSLPGLGEFLLELINKLRLKNYALVGLSLGAIVISESAINKLEGCKGIVLASSSIINDDYHIANIIKSLPVKNVFATGHPSDHELMSFLKLCGYNLTDDWTNYAFQAFQSADPEYRVKLGESLASKVWTDEIDNLRKTNIPICFIVGAEDNLVDLNYLEKLSLLKWRNKIHWIARAGHMVNWDQPAAFNSLLQAYFADSFV